MDTTHYHRQRRLGRLVPCALLFALGALSPLTGAQCEPGWVHTPGFGFGGINGIVTSSVMWDPDGAGPLPEWLVVGGMFEGAGDVAARSIAAYDGERWHDLGGVSEGFIFDRVSALMVYGGRLIVGGHFAKAGDVPAENIAAYDGAAWHPLGQGVYDGFSEPEVTALTEFGGKLIAAGAFASAGQGPAGCIASWDGNEWSALGAGVDGPVLAVGTLGGELLVGGQFHSAGNQVPQTEFLARWDGTGWSSVDGGANGLVHSMYEDGDGLWVGGGYSRIGNLATTNLARWDGGQFHAAGSGVLGAVFAIARFGGDLYAGGNIFSAGGVPVAGIARWDGAGWHPLGSGVGQSPLALTDMGDRLFVGGQFRVAGGEATLGVAYWDGGEWSVPPGREPGIEAVGLSVSGDDLILSGYTRPVSGGYLSEVVRFDGLEWTTMGGSFDELVWDTGTHDGGLYAVGWFRYADGNEAAGVARWTGSEWVGLGSGLSGGYVTSGLCIGSYAGDLIIGGDFTGAGGVDANHVARWDGAQWHRLGGGIGDEYSFVWELVEYQGDLIAVGEFGVTGDGPAANVARWDGSGWSPLGSGLGGGFLPGAQAATLFEGGLVVGGDFTNAGGTPAINIARWDGSQWSALGAGIPEHGVASLAVYNGRLYAGGEFVFSDGSNTRILVWDGSVWQRVGGGVNGAVGELEPFKTELFMTGGFSAAGGRAAPGLARWSDTQTPWFARQPDSLGACLGVDAHFTAALALGYEDAALRWLRDGQPLSDGPTGYGSFIGGSDNGGLAVADVHAPDAGVYALTADNGCAVAVSAPATLSVCVADYDCSGGVNTADVLAFLNAWGAGDSHADLNGDGRTDTLDVLAFLNAWGAGC
jgi:hypothetical protein